MSRAMVERLLDAAKREQWLLPGGMIEVAHEHQAALDHLVAVTEAYGKGAAELGVAIDGVLTFLNRTEG